MNKLTLQDAFQQTFHNKYTFSDFLTIDVDKSCETIQLRNIQILSPNDELKDYLHFIKVFIINHLQYSKNSVYSYISGVSILECLEPHKTKRYFLTTDIKNFFSSIQKEDIEKILKENSTNLPIDKNDIVKYGANIVDLITYDSKLPVGFPTSPRLSNAFLFAFDKTIEEYIAAHKIVYSRYSDDLIFSSDDKQTLKKLLEFVEATLQTIYGKHMMINHHKTKFYNRGNKIKILGAVITPNSMITVDKTLKSDIEILFHFYKTDRAKYNEILKQKFDDNERKVFGILSYINSLDSAYLIKLRKKYGNYIVDAFLHRSIYE